MTPQQALLVQKTFAVLAPRSEDVARLFYDKLFELDPALRELFKEDLAVQGRKLMTMLSSVVEALDRFADVVPAVEGLARRHVYYGVRDGDYDTVGAALVATLEAGLAEAFTDVVREAWIAAYTALAGTMRDTVRSAPLKSPAAARGKS